MASELLGGVEAAGLFSNWREKIIGRFRDRVIARLIQEGVPEAEARDMISKIGDGAFLDWLIKNGPDIIAFIKMILALFGLGAAPANGPK